MMTSHTGFGHTQSTAAHNHIPSNKSPTHWICTMSDPNLDFCTAWGLKGSTSAFIPEVDDAKALIPPPLPLKRHQRSPEFETTLSQGPQLKAFNIESSLACKSSPGGPSQCLDLVPGEVQDMHSSCIFLPKVEQKCHKNEQTQFAPRPPLTPPIKPPRHNKPKRAELEEENTGDKKNRQEQELVERNENTEENGETSKIESHLHIGKPPRQILVIFTEYLQEKGGEDRGEEDEEPNNIGLTTTLTKNSSLLAMKGSDLTSDEEPDMAATNRKSIVSVKQEPTIPPQPPPKSHQKCRPKPPIKPPQLFSAMRSRIEEETENRKQVDEWLRDNGLVDKERNKEENEGKDGGKVNVDTESMIPTMTEMPSRPTEIVMKSIPKSSVYQEVELPRAGQRFCLMPPCRNKPTSEITTENKTLHHSQLPGKQHQNHANEVHHGPLPKKITIPVRWVQDSEVISKLQSGHQEGTEVVGSKLDPHQLDAQEIAEMLLDGELKQTIQKTNARGKVKQLAKKVIGRLKEGREDKRRSKALEMETDDTELTQDERWHGEEEGMKDKEEEEGNDEVTVDQSAVTETQSYAGLIKGRIARRNATSESPFSFFKVSSPVKLVEELLSGDEWSQFLHRDQSPTNDPPPCQTHLEDTGQLSANFQLNSSGEQGLTLDVFEGNHAVSENPIYEDIDLPTIIKEEQQTREQQQNRACSTAIPSILLERETNPISPRTKDIYDTVVFMKPVQPNFSDVKSQCVLSTSVQKYIIKLSKKRKHRPPQKRHHHNSQADTLNQSTTSTSPQVFSTSIFYNAPPSGGEELLSTVKPGGSSPRSLAKIKTMLRGSSPKEDRGK
ncbi:uncharacterized protein si:dkey-9i23.6 [Morone saxatilis]|uniref:uncharacterized protein si:dkey-9i23.6 n=1 Tax=Morone saxatilis TaxID=34816 RepID=UPI0015E1D125|nr:uncharacterized protein si:dkey-9i23.6 [Morone saxatilis]